jgi:hypothetical protein
LGWQQQVRKGEPDEANDSHPPAGSVAGDDARRNPLRRARLAHFQARFGRRGEVVRSNPARREYPCLIGKHTSKAARLGQSGHDRDDSDQDKDRQRDVPIAEDDILDELLY